ncbi:unnamed protein product, partial [marine sediment metagenome]
MDNITKKLICILLFLPIASFAEEDRVFGKTLDIAGTWETLVSFPYSISAWLDEGIYSEFTVKNATIKYRDDLSNYFKNEPVFKEIQFGTIDEGYLVFFNNPEIRVKMFYSDSGKQNGSIRLIHIDGNFLWIDFIHIEEDTML